MLIWTLCIAVYANAVDVGRYWHERFRRAYEVELFEWVESVRNGKITGPSAWDGYQSSAVADVAVAAGEAHRELEVAIGTCPDFYRES